MIRELVTDHLVETWWLILAKAQFFALVSLIVAS